MTTKKKPRAITFKFSQTPKGQKRFSALIEILTGKPFDPNPADATPDHPCSNSPFTSDNQ